MTAPASPNMLSAGTILSASLITGLNSDLPGNIIAQVTAPAYDSVTGRTVLIPQGSRILGSYDNVVAFGQQRALVVWQRIILPDGSSVRIDNWPVSDMQGYAGLADRIDRHTWQLLKGVALSTLLGVGTEIGFAGESDLVEAIRESAQQSGARAGDQLVRKNLDVPPTIRVRLAAHRHRPQGSGPAALERNVTMTLKLSRLPDRNPVKLTSAFHRTCTRRCPIMRRSMPRPMGGPRPSPT